jgi:hypothetical protein
LKQLEKNPELVDTWRDTIRTGDVDELKKWAAKGDVRKKYDDALKGFVETEEKLMAKYANDPDKYEKVAKEMFELRLKTTTKFKLDETPPDLLEWIHKFNEKRYGPIGGNKWGHTWESIMNVNKKKYKGDEVYKKIIESSKTSLGGGDIQKLGLELYQSLGDDVLPVLEKYRMTKLINK